MPIDQVHVRLPQPQKEVEKALLNRQRMCCREKQVGESSMWGDYHARELGVMILREANGERYMTFFE